jgi:hypothetical protein
MKTLRMTYFLVVFVVLFTPCYLLGSITSIAWGITSKAWDDTINGWGIKG